MRQFLPAIRLDGASVVIIGAGPMAEAKARLFVGSPAKLTWFTLDRTATVPAELDNHINVRPGPVDEAELSSARFVFIAVDDENLALRLVEHARSGDPLINVVDRPELSDFFTPAIVDRGAVTIAISTGGGAPVLAVDIRAAIERVLRPGVGRLADIAAGLRNVVKASLPSVEARRRFWERALRGSAADRADRGDDAGALSSILDDLRTPEKTRGIVHLVGAGPGDPDLLTFRALRLMQRCDVVLYDRLVGDDIMSLVRRDAKRVYVGKLPKEHTMQQEDISGLMVRLAKDGNRVLRLKGGDPFIFGRGGEEIEKLAENGIGFQVVPGITAAAGCGSYAGIPLTHRDHAQSCTFVTAHGKDGALALDWKTLIQPGHTLAVYMGLSNLPALVAGAATLGVDMSTPVAVIQNGTRVNQVVVTGPLSDIADLAQAAQLKSPAMIIIGSVVTLRDKLNWTGNFDGGEVMALSSATTPGVMAQDPSAQP